MISSTMSQALLRSVFTDLSSPYRQHGFAFSLHTDANPGGASTEIESVTYSRVLYGHGESYWSIGSRSATNRAEILFPATGDTEMWPAVRALGLWDVRTGAFMWGVAFDIGSYVVGTGDRLSVPVNGLVMSLG
jgi:hypothetical protein